MEKRVTVIGAAVVDIFAGPVDKELFTRGSVPAPNTGICCGGDAMNEAVFLSSLGLNTEMVTLLGTDEAAQTVQKCLKDNKISSDMVTISPEIITGMNIVLVDGEGERYFITNPESSLRKLSKAHILPYVDSMGDIVSFASIFVSYELDMKDMEEVFRAIKSKEERILIADMTNAKKGEKIEDIAPFLRYIDYIVPNVKEAELLTGESDPEKSAESFINHGAKCVIIKCGKDGCLYHDGRQIIRIPAYPAKVLDTTGAGDSFVAGFICGLSRGMDLTDSCRYGCAVASTVVEHMGSQQVHIDVAEVNRRFEGL